MKAYHLKLAFTFYWFLLAGLSASAAQDPGFVRHPELEPFPWLGLLITWVALAIVIVFYYFMLKPFFTSGSSNWLLAALLLSLVMTLICFSFFAFTDVPGLFYIPHKFSLLTFTILLLISFFRAGQSAFYRLRKAG